MAYNEFNLTTLKKRFPIKIEESSDLFATATPVSVSVMLRELLDDQIPLALTQSTEKARSEFIIAPVLVETRKQLGNRVGLFSGVEFNVDFENGLRGVCDFLFSLSSLQSVIEAPVLAVVEAKNGNIRSGLGQCAAEMIAARQYNEAEESPMPVIFGAVTSGSEWRFLQLQNDTLFIDSVEYSIIQVDKIIGILVWMLREADQNQIVREGKAPYRVL